ncbi:hydantoinase/oxoprolinase family protein [Nonomuraea cavernae]|uniref:hydantoinase/oxoprolinase family protein n=1 Tax=Nonomuraea cavernae TaxID=2045107 RepID=UPI0033F78FE4
MRIGIDVGGTFTDIYLQDSDTGRFWLGKTPSTVEQSEGVATGIRQVCELAGIQPQELDAVLHGTTVATNAVLEGKGARVGLLVTAGWRNILHLGNSWTPGPLFGFFDYQPPEPMVPFERIQEVTERISPSGEVIIALDPESARRAVDAILDEDVEAITICLLNAHGDPAHELAVREIAVERCRARGADLPISVSSEVSAEFREYERTVTTVMNSYLGPAMRRYLSRLEERLASAGVSAPLQVVRSDAGLMSGRAAQEYPVHTVLSGPSGGVNGAAHIGGRAGFDRVLTLDMGGTSTDVAVCMNGAAAVSRESKVGSFPIRVPSVDVETIGAGGGSIANVSEITGGLRVGPESAGAQPGPACYARGGTLPTVSDANVVLGHLPAELLGGAMKLDVEAAHAAVQTVATELGVGVHEAAQAIVDIVNGNMLGALRVVTVQKGLDPKDFALMSFGGAGGLHANAIAAELGSFPVIVPPEPGVLSALGFIVADVRNEFVQSFHHKLGDEAVSGLAEVTRSQAARGREWLRSEGVDESDVRLTHLFDMRYLRQGYEISVEFTEEEARTLTLDRLTERFTDEHRRLYGFELPTQIELVNVGTRAIGVTSKHAVEALEGGDRDASAAITGTSNSWHDGEEIEIPIYDRAKLEPGMVISGKALVQQFDSTTVILPGYLAEVDAWRNLLIREA